MRIALRFAYDGDCFESYARDPGRRNVEDTLLAGLKKVGYSPSHWRTGSRTDRGVCAAENVARVDIERPHLTGIVPELQYVLPEGLWITGVMEVPPDFEPRRAIRTYSYTAGRHGEDLARMQEACELFVGEHDMTGFARLDGGRNPVRRIVACSVEAHDDWVFKVTGKGFLWNQVRRMVQAILLVGRGQYDVSHLEENLKGIQVHEFGLAPAGGLLLERVDVGLAWPEQKLPHRYLQELTAKRRTQLRLVQCVRALNELPASHASAQASEDSH